MLRIGKFGFLARAQPLLMSFYCSIIDAPELPAPQTQESTISIAAY
jgi:hypothetical protein